MKVSDFDYDLPPDLIARYPLPNRTHSRMLCLNRAEKNVEHHVFSDILNYINAGDLLVLNDTRVVPARLYGQKGTGGQIEVLVERVLDQQHMLVHIRASKAPPKDSELFFFDGTRARVLGRQHDLFEIEVFNQADLFEWLERVGEIPLPPYLKRVAQDLDKERYQTVYANEKGAVAAPTAGLHFDVPLLEALKAKGVAIAHVTLHVGAGTFQSIRVEELVDHVMHHEFVKVPESVCAAIKATKARGGRVIAVGTTTMRSLETAALSGVLQPFEGETNIFIYPGFQFICVDALITNFHLPQSTLMMLVCAFAGYDLMMSAYQEAVRERYRFFSYGDAMLIC